MKIWILLFVLATKAEAGCPKTWKRPFTVDRDLYPFASHCLSLPLGTIHYIDIGPKDSQKPVVVAVHGNPTWSFTFRKIAKIMQAENQRFIALDLFGFGMSSKPLLEKFGYHAHEHAEVFKLFIQSLNLNNIVLLAGDWGGPVGLHALTQEPERVQGLLLFNTWSWALERIPEGETSPYHVFHDWGLEHLVNEPYYVKTMQTIHRVGKGIPRRNGAEPGSEMFKKLQHAMTAPFLKNGKPTVDHAVMPVVRFPQSLLNDHDFLKNLDRNMEKLYQKPVYFMFGDGTAFGPVKCDVGPVFPRDFPIPPVATLNTSRAFCPEGFHCESENPELFRHNCLGKDGNTYWAILSRYFERWNSKQIKGVMKLPGNGEWLQEEVPEQVALGLQTLLSADSGR